MPIYLNGKEVARLGAGESFEIKTPNGKHTLSAEWVGIDKGLIKPANIQIVKNGTSAHYVILGITAKFLDSKVTLIETSAQSYLSAAQ